MNPLHPNISIHTFTKVLTRKICQTTKSFLDWWSFPLFYCYKIVTAEEILESHVACLLTYKFPSVTTSAFPDCGWWKTLFPRSKGNINDPLKFINCTSFQKIRLENVVSTFHHQEIPPRNNICSMTAWPFLRSTKDCLPFFFKVTLLESS